MRKFFWLYSLLFFAPLALAQVTISGTVVDQGGVTWQNGTYSFDFQQAPNQSNTGYFLNGVAFPQSQWHLSGVLTAGGGFSLSLPQNTKITPSGSQWQGTFCPNASAACINFPYTVSQAQDISTTITANAPALAVRPNGIPRAYNDAEVSVSPSLVGYIYQNVTTNTPRYWNGFQWNLFGQAAPEVYATNFLGVDIAAQTIAALNSCTYACNVIIPNGVYPTTTTLNMGTGRPGFTGWTQVTMQPGAVINYSGTGAAVSLPVSYFASGYNKFQGGTINCLNKAGGAVGLQIWPSNHTTITDTIIQGCHIGIQNLGGNSGAITNNRLISNDLAIQFSGMVCQNFAVNCSPSLNGQPNTLGFSSNAFLVQANEIGNNLSGFEEINPGLSITPMTKNTLHANIFEANTNNDVWSHFALGLSVEDNYFESLAPNPVLIGDGISNSNGATVRNNHFTTGSYNTAVIKIQSGSISDVSGNDEIFNGSFATCFFDTETLVQPSFLGYNYTTIPQFGGGTFSGGTSTEIYSCRGGGAGAPPDFYNLPLTGVEPPGGANGQNFHVKNGNVVVDGNVTGNTIKGLLNPQGGSFICSGNGAPDATCPALTGGTLWLNTGATTGTFPFYYRANGAWVGGGTVYP